MIRTRPDSPSCRASKSWKRTKWGWQAKHVYHHPHSHPATCRKQIREPERCRIRSTWEKETVEAFHHSAKMVLLLLLLLHSLISFFFLSAETEKETETTIKYKRERKKKQSERSHYTVTETLFLKGSVDSSKILVSFIHSQVWAAWPQLSQPKDGYVRTVYMLVLQEATFTHCSNGFSDIGYLGPYLNYPMREMKLLNPGQSTACMPTSD